MNLHASLANAAWAGASLRAWRQFNASLANPEAAQRQVLTACLRNNAGSAIGRAHGFSRLLEASDTITAFQQTVPIVTYDALEPFIGRVASGEQNVMTGATVQRLSPSSGSTSAAKLIPQTTELQREFSRAVDAWIADLFLRCPRLIGGPAYWSITPAISADAIATARLARPAHGASVPIGFDDDSAYLGGVREWLVRRILAVPCELRMVADPETFRYVSLLHLARARDLRLISVWHPSFLIELLDRLPDYLERIIDDTARGTLTPPGPIGADVYRIFSAALRPDPRRAAELRRVPTPGARDIWPHLALVSCWADGAARSYAERLSRAIPGVELQPKGLIATEAIVSIPFRGLHPLAVRSHFFEFIDPSGQARLAHDLLSGVDYSVVVTTAGGLYRYQLGDRVRVNGTVGRTPSIEFVGRSDRVSDRFGEKLSDGFVTGILADLFANASAPRFAMLAPEMTAEGIAYTLLVEADGALPANLAGSLETALRANPHYAWCVDLRQLRPARVIRVGPNADRAYLATCVARGQRLGDVKPMSLHPDLGWSSLLGARE